MSDADLHAKTTRQDLSPATATLQVAVAGTGGYAGGELARLLMRHPRLKGRMPLLMGRPSEYAQEVPLSQIHPALTTYNDLYVVPFDWDRIERDGVHLLLLATPHETSRAYVPEALKRGIRVIDLSGAWRLHDPLNASPYQCSGEDPSLTSSLQSEAIYGSPELHKDAISTARLVANPGCYATSIILALAPLLQSSLVDLSQGIICDSKSGVSGAGKTPSPDTHFMQVADNLSAYAVFTHRHLGELLEQLHLTDTEIVFTPHVLPIPRGILTTIYLRLKRPSDALTLNAILRQFYRDCPFVRVRRPGNLPQIQDVVHTNFCDVGAAIDRDSLRVILIVCIDNLLKGAAGQAIQNMNIMYGWNESEGLL